jgi:hypothetical protein
MHAHTTAPTSAIASAAPSPAALPAPPAASLAQAADALISVLANTLRAAKAEGIEVPHEPFHRLALWALRERCILACPECGAVRVGPVDRPVFCSECSARMDDGAPRETAASAAVPR